MERNAVIEAYDGVQIRLLDGRVLRCASFSVAEASHFIGLFAGTQEGDMDALETFVEEFGARAGLGSAPLDGLGMVVEWEGEPIGLGDLTFDDAQALCELFRVACWAEDIQARSKAQVRWLDEVPVTFGLGDIAPDEVFAFGRDFSQAFYLHVYGIAEGFCSRLAASPAATTWEVLGRNESWTSATGSLT